jgi:aminoglycoside phosphotransferase (APT) family kinase protein
MLEQSDITHYLLSLGLVKPRAVVEEDLTVIDVSRRNRVHLAATHAGPSYVVKQAEPETAATLAHEAAVLRALAEHAELAGQIPTVVRYEPEAALLVMSTPGGASDWSHIHGGGRFPLIPARILGRTLAALHRLPADCIEELPSGFDRMWGLSLPEPPHELLLDLSAVAQDLVARLQASDGMCERLDALRKAGSDGAAVHGDLRWDNCLALAAPGMRRRTRVMLVDWELAGRGAAGFDVGTAIAEYLRVWVESIPVVVPGDAVRFVERARYPLRRMQPAMQALWSAYSLANPLRPTLRRVVELAAVRLLQTAVELAQGLTAPTAQVVILVQLADNMLRDPDDAALNLIALRE